MNNSGPKGSTGACYTLAIQITCSRRAFYNGKNQPDVHIIVHFVRNQAKGGMGGGGYGAAGAITLTSGDLKITNAVFQDLGQKAVLRKQF